MGTLCWECARAGTGTCSWDQEFVPVEGWTARRTVHRRKDGKGYQSYHIKACPLFVQGRRATGMVATERTVDYGLLDMLIRDGKPVAEICAKAGVSENTVYRRIGQLRREEGDEKK